MLIMDYRYQARLHLDRAKGELASGDDHRVAYAALELRKAIEAVTYDRMQAYKAEIPPDEYETWQPRRVMQLLLEIDPLVDTPGSFGMAFDRGHEKFVRDMGTDEVFSLKQIKANYDALGSFLHIPTLAKINEEIDHAKLRKRCDAIAAEVRRVLDARVFNCTIGEFSTSACQRCEKPVHRRLAEGDEVEAQCLDPDCKAPHTLKRLEVGRIQWKAKGSTVECPADGCDATPFLWEDQIKPGTWWTCEGCGQRIRVDLGLTILPSDQTNVAGQDGV